MHKQITSTGEKYEPQRAQAPCGGPGGAVRWLDDESGQEVSGSAALHAQSCGTVTDATPIDETHLLPRARRALTDEIPAARRGSKVKASVAGHRQHTQRGGLTALQSLGVGDRIGAVAGQPELVGLAVDALSTEGGEDGCGRVLRHALPPQ